MACEDIENRLQDLREQKRDLEAAIPSMQGPGLQHAQERMAALESQIYEEEINLQDCRRQDSPSESRPFTGLVDSITCIKASGREIGKEEPYLVIATVDMQAVVTLPPPVPGVIGKPAVNTFLVGPWSGVKSHSTRWTEELKEDNRPPFWYLNGKPKIIQSPQDVIFLVALLENDNSGPNAVQQAVNNLLEISIVNNLQLAVLAVNDALADNVREEAYNNFVRELKAAMKGGIEFGVASGAPFWDELIGEVQQLILTSDDIGRINTFGNHSKLLTFQRFTRSSRVRDNYDVKFYFTIWT